MRFKKRPQLPGAGRTRGWHHHGSHTPTSPGVIFNVKWPITPKQICRQCISMETRRKKQTQTQKKLFTMISGDFVITVTNNSLNDVK